MLATVDEGLVARAAAGDASARDTLQRTVTPAFGALALRVLGRDDAAARATQVMLAQLTAALDGARGDSVALVWLLRPACRHLRAAPTEAAEAPAVSFDAIRHWLDEGLAAFHPSPVRATAADHAQARAIALACTQGMLLALERPMRLAWTLDTVLAVAPTVAAAALELSPADHRALVTRAATAVRAFIDERCGLVNPDARCRCLRQARAGRRGAIPVLAHTRVELPAVHDASAPTYLELSSMPDADAVLTALAQSVMPTPLDA